MKKILTTIFLLSLMVLSTISVSAFTVPQGYSEVVEFSNPGDMLEVFEGLGGARETVTEFEMNALEGKVYQDRNGASPSNQYLRFEDMSEPIQPMTPFHGIAYDRTPNVLADFLVAREGAGTNADEAVFEWETEFMNGFETDIIGRTLVQLEDEKIKIMEDEYYVREAEISGNTIEVYLVKGDFTGRLL